MAHFRSNEKPRPRAPLLPIQRLQRAREHLLKHDGRIVIGGLEELILKKFRELRWKLRK
jgi:hypothetical protein